MATILAARRIYLTAWGEGKAEIIQKTIEGPITDQIPATFLQTHNDVHVVTDLAAAGKLTRIVHPWLVTSLEWTDKLVRSALVWLCQKTGKPILKLTNKDYNENGLNYSYMTNPGGILQTSQVVSQDVSWWTAPRIAIEVALLAANIGTSLNAAGGILENRVAGNDGRQVPPVEGFHKGP